MVAEDVVVSFLGAPAALGDAVGGAAWVGVAVAGGVGLEGALAAVEAATGLVGGFLCWICGGLEGGGWVEDVGEGGTVAGGYSGGR